MSYSPLRSLLLLLPAALLGPLLVTAAPTPAAAAPDTAADTVVVDSLDTLCPRASLSERLQQLVDGEALLCHSQVGLYVYDLDADSAVYGYGEQQLMRPASCQKLITAVAGLSLLGTDYRYRTQLYLVGGDTDSTATVYLRGGFDPLLGDADVRTLADSLRRRGITRLDGPVHFDRTMKDTADRGWGWCWDDKVTPLTPLLYNGRTGLESQFIRALQQTGLSVPQTAIYDEVPSHAECIAQVGHTIDQVLLPMMKDSKNLYAESLFYQIAALKPRHPDAAHKDAIREIEHWLKNKVGIDADYKVADGSGLSPYNWTTPHILVALLRYAYHDAALYRHLLPTLPIAGRDGTLDSRLKSRGTRDNVRAKTGTVDGVSTLAGYCTADNGHRLCFAILNQGVYKAARGRAFQDKVCRVMVGEEE
jgi:D-alanyl-D-alanine carboxypeptidase/D-alanyl-D-alanine-endopeptidase (penicillin-binding protein 4)